MEKLHQRSLHGGSRGGRLPGLSGAMVARPARRASRIVPAPRGAQFRGHRSLRLAAGPAIGRGNPRHGTAAVLARDLLHQGRASHPGHQGAAKPGSLQAPRIATIEHCRGLLREASRITAPDGVIVVTTPNVLNVRSRVRYLVSGFANLFGPLPMSNQDRSCAGAHISPIPYFYLAHALIEAGFENVELRIDKAQKTSVLWLLLLAPIIFIGGARFMRLERARFKTLTPENEVFVKAHFSSRLLVARTIVASPVKPNAVRKAQIAA